MKSITSLSSKNKEKMSNSNSNNSEPKVTKFIVKKYTKKTLEKQNPLIFPRIKKED